MVDMKALQAGVVGFIVVVVSIVLGVVLTDTLGNTTGLGTEAQNVAANGTSLLGSILTDWGEIIILGLIVVAVFVGMLLALNFIARRGGGR